jgi:hypothetical protein
MFQTFRRHQKRWLTGLTILAMIAFAFPLTSTYFDSGPGSGRRRVEVIDTIFDKRITNEDLERARLERILANSFYQMMIAAVYPQFGFRIGEVFGTPRDDDAIKDAIRLTHKADELGIRVSDEMIRNWILRESDGKLTTQQFEEAVSRAGRAAPQYVGERGVSPEMMFDILRGQLRIQQVQALIAGRFGSPTPVTPYEAWTFYRKLNDKFGLEVIPVSVADYAAEIEDPGDGVLRERYNKYISQLPDPASPEPGFKEPRRVDLQSASVTLDAFALAIKPTLEVTDAEIEQYYESHKDLYRVRATDLAAPSAAPTAAPTELPSKPEPDSSEPPADKKEPEAAKDPEAKSETKESKSPDNNPPTKQSGEPGDSCQQETAKEQAATESAAQKAEDDKPAAQDGQDAAKDESQKDNKSGTDAATDAAKQEGQQDSTKKDDDKPAAPQYKPLEEVSAEIRDIVSRDKSRAELIKRLNQIGQTVNDYGRKVFLPAQDKFEDEKLTNPTAKFVPPPKPDFSGDVEAAGLQFAETGLTALDQEPFASSSLGKSIELQGGRARGRSIVEVIGSADFYEPRESQNLITDEYFSVWKTEDVPEQEPSFEQIRGKVLLSYQMEKARELALARANKLANSLRELNGDVAKLRETEAGFETITIPPLPLWSNAPVYTMSMMPRPNRIATELPGLRFPSDEFRTKLFELNEGDVTVAPNQPQDLYYVVAVSKRQVASREDFVRSKQMIEMQVESEQATKMVTDWLVNLRRESAGAVKRQPIAGN